MNARSNSVRSGLDVEREHVRVLLFKDTDSERRLSDGASHGAIKQVRDGLPNARNDHRPSQVRIGVAPELAEVAKHFDADYYAHEYPDIDARRTSLMDHFCRVGWREGRNPNAFFDTASYLLINGDVCRSRINPYFHYLRHGAIEGRLASSSISPSIRSRLLFGRPVLDWVERLRPHIDLEYYCEQLRDVDVDGLDFAAHFAYRGWREGISPNRTFDVLAWLQAHPAAEQFAVNPLVIQLEGEAGNFDIGSMAKNSVVSAPPIAGQNASSVEPANSFDGSPVARNAPSEAQATQIELVRTEFDRAFYLDANPDVADAGIDPLEHYFHTGWREGRNPNNDFDTRYYLAANKDVRAQFINPFVHYLATGRLEGRPTRAVRHVPLTAQTEGAVTQEDILAAVRPHFDKAYYLAAYPDVAAAGIDPLLHFFHTGWSEGRNPSLLFDTKYYLEMNEDVRDAGVNPFWHYLSSGRGEGRLPRRPGGYRRQIIDAAVEPAKRPLIGLIEGEKAIRPATLLRKLEASAKRHRKGLIVSLSHDCYIRVIGGTQIFIADEQARFNESGYAYVHISPQIARLTLAAAESPSLVRVVVDGKLAGLSPIDAVRGALEKIKSKSNDRPDLVIHSMMGFGVKDVMKLCVALQPKRRIYWLHDYSTLCEGFNLLRNDAQFCGAPPASSLACRVCVYGKTRKHYLEGMRALFKTCRFDVASPSAFALKLWVKSTDLPRMSEAVHPHWRLVLGKSRRKKPIRKNARRPVSVAFVGFPSPNKGWQIFCEAVQRFHGDKRYKFFHFAARNTSSLPHVKFIQTEVTAADRYATRRLLEDNGIDLVALLSPWPETFSFVAHEAIAAGSKIVCFEESGNVADVVRQLGCGHIAKDAEALMEFFGSGAAAALANSGKPDPSYSIDQTGTTATFNGFVQGEVRLPT